MLAPPQARRLIAGGAAAVGGAGYMDSNAGFAREVEWNVDSANNFERVL